MPAEPTGLPDFLVIGANRSGTTSLHRYLRAHPQVFLPAAKELHFFDERPDEDIDWYRTQLAGGASGALRGEATPSYMRSRRALERIAARVPDARLVASLREPVDRAYSHYWMRRERGLEDRTFTEAVEAELDAGDPGDDHAGYVAGGLYAQQLAWVDELFPAENVHVLLFEDLRDRPAETFAAVCRFLGVDDAIVPDEVGRKVNAYVRIRSPRLRRLVRDRLPVGNPLRRAVDRLNTRQSASYPPMPAALRDRLVDHYRAPNAALAERLGRPLTVWAAPAG